MRVRCGCSFQKKTKNNGEVHSLSKDHLFSSKYKSSIFPLTLICPILSTKSFNTCSDKRVSVVVLNQVHLSLTIKRITSCGSLLPLHLINLPVQLHHLGGLHQLLLESAPHSLPVFPLTENHHVLPWKNTASPFKVFLFIYFFRSINSVYCTYRMRSPYASFLRSLYAFQGLISSLWG